MEIKRTSLFVFVVPLTETLLDGLSSSESSLVDEEALRFKPLLPLTAGTDGLFAAEPK